MKCTVHPLVVTRVMIWLLTIIRLLLKGARFYSAAQQPCITAWEQRHRGYIADHVSVVRTVSCNSSPLTSRNEGEEGRGDKVV